MLNPNTKKIQGENDNGFYSDEEDHDEVYVSKLTKAEELAKLML